MSHNIRSCAKRPASDSLASAHIWKNPLRPSGIFGKILFFYGALHCAYFSKNLLCLQFVYVFIYLSYFTCVPWENLSFIPVIHLIHPHFLNRCTHTHANNWMDAESGYLVCLLTLEFCHQRSSNGWPEKGCHPQHHLANAPSSAYELR